MGPSSKRGWTEPWRSNTPWARTRQLLKRARRIRIYFPRIIRSFGRPSPARSGYGRKQTVRATLRIFFWRPRNKSRSVSYCAIREAAQATTIFTASLTAVGPRQTTMSINRPTLETAITTSALRDRPSLRYDRYSAGTNHRDTEQGNAAFYAILTPTQQARLTQMGGLDGPGSPGGGPSPGGFPGGPGASRRSRPLYENR